MESPLLHSRGARFLAFAAFVVTALILLWTVSLWGKTEADDLLGTYTLKGLATIFFVLFARDDQGGAICALIVLFLAMLVPLQLRTRRLVGWVGLHPWPPIVVAAAAMAWGTVFIYRDHPLSMDEYSAVFQAKIFAAGKLTGQLPVPLLDWLIPRGFQNKFINVSHVTGLVASSYWPSFSLLLTPFFRLGVPWLCNPLISALTALVIHRIALRMFDSTEAAGLALLLTLASPVLFADGISYYSMPAHLLANSLFVLLLMQPSVSRALAAGVVGSIALTLHNPVPHALFALPWLVWLACQDNRWKLLGALITGYLPLCLLLGLGWFVFSQHLVQAGVAQASTASGTHTGLQHLLAIFKLPSQTVMLARLIGLCKIWIWAVPGLALLAIAGAWSSRHLTLVRLLSASALLTLIGYVFVSVDQGHGWGYRYFHSAWLVLPLLGAAALYGTRTGRPAPVFSDEGTRAYAAACALLSLLLCVGFRGVQIHEFMDRYLDQVPHFALAGPRVIVIDDIDSFYAGDMVQNDPWLRGDVVRIYSHDWDPDLIARMMHQNFPHAHQVYSDDQGSVWDNKSSNTINLTDTPASNPP